MGKRIRRAVAAAWPAVAGMVLTGCSGFLVPAGEGEPEPTPSATRTVPSGVHADALPPTPAAPPSPPVTGAPDGGSRPGDGATASGVCPASGVVVDMGQVETAMMHRAVVLTLTNCGDKPYRVNGYPSVQALGEEGERLPVKVNPGGSYFGQDPGPKEVTLKPGAAVKSILAWVSTQEGGDLIEGDALEIAAATDTGARVFPLEGHDIRLMDELNMTAWRTRPST
ncbi:DUF4232 domain-containing protein [Streptomyces sp. NPDC052179]|uniref:DUF4232 domain-containing protein n=1 Tax=Streptomyces sp. NPDC052179 TaxID=3155680 RepID=UPI0034221D8F